MSKVGKLSLLLTLTLESITPSGASLTLSSQHVKQSGEKNQIDHEHYSTLKCYYKIVEVEIR